MLVVLIGDMDGGEHSVAPVFKISDLGLGKCRPDRDPDLTTPCVYDYDGSCPPPTNLQRELGYRG